MAAQGEHDPPAWLVPRAAYVHVPFCRTKCLYCDFNTYAGKDRLIPEYVAALATEIRRASGACSGLPLRSVYFGGGTPSLLTIAQLRRLLDALRRGAGIEPNAEVTLEANPGTFGPVYLEGLVQLGVNRLSLGVQSLDDETLRRLARTHNATQALDALRQARAAGFASVNLDLIYGLPWQSLQAWTDHLRRALDTAPDHVSLYALMVEEGTPLATLVARGTWGVPDEDCVTEMYEAALPVLREAGFTHYEVSNWARPGHESRHNLVYWRNEAYLGCGAGAHAYIDGVRAWNARPIQEYIRQVTSGASPTEGSETLADAALVGETAALALRLPVEGLDFARFRQRFGVDPRDRWHTELRDLSEAGVLRVTNERATIREHALLVNNEIAARFV